MKKAYEKYIDKKTLKMAKIREMIKDVLHNIFGGTYYGFIS
jgi:hypothetical protein